MAVSPGRRRNDGEATVNPWQPFADEMKAQREAAALTQEELAKLMGYSASVIAKLETCRVIPSPDHAGKADEALRMPGTFRRMRTTVLNGAYGSWVQALIDLEERATVLRSVEPLVVPGLLQTEEYAREIIRSAHPGDGDAEVEQLVTGRMARQGIWDREDPPPPMLAVILGEAVIRQRVGEADVMRDQLGRLVEAAHHPRISIQVMPFSTAAHPGMLGHFMVASFENGPDSAYLDNALDWQITERRKQVARLWLLYETLAREALSPRESVELIKRRVEEWT
jgi:transcriptional regulator with XRE-family HTH domain